MKRFILFFALMLSLSSCVEIIDDLSINSDGSGTFKYAVNLSWSKVRVNSILALDSLDGKRVPSLDEIKQIIEDYRVKLEEKEGISEVKVDANYTDFILKFECKFNNVTNLQRAIREIVIEKDKNQDLKEINHIWLAWDGAKLVRSVPTLTTQTTQRLKNEDLESLKKGTYASITRFDKPIEKCENPLAQISPSKTACRIKTTPFALVNDIQILENTILLSPKKP